MISIREPNRKFLEFAIQQLDALKHHGKIIRATLICLLALCLSSSDSHNAEHKPAIEAFEKVGLIKGEHYIILKNPLPVDSIESLSVIEFFWYGCGHCLKIEEPLKQWLGSLPSRVKFEKMPAIWKDSMGLHARAHYIAASIDPQRMTKALFPLILQIRKSNDLDEHKRELQQFFARYYINDNEFETLWQDETILNNVERAAAWQKQAKVSGTPAIIIDGKYMVNNPALGDVTNIIPVADKMVRALLRVAT